MHSKRALIALAAIIGVGALGLLVLVGTPASGMCHGASPKSYQVIIQHGAANPKIVTGHLCDMVTIKNLDSVTREIAFGPHEDHVAYDGVAERFLNRSQSFTLTFNATGKYYWHDHLHDEVWGSLVVDK
jgi:hypothetical protein